MGSPCDFVAFVDGGDWHECKGGAERRSELRSMYLSDPLQAFFVGRHEMTALPPPVQAEQDIFSMPPDTLRAVVQFLDRRTLFNRFLNASRAASRMPLNQICVKAQTRFNFTRSIINVRGSGRSRSELWRCYRYSRKLLDLRGYYFIRFPKMDVEGHGKRTFLSNVPLFEGKLGEELSIEAAARRVQQLSIVKLPVIERLALRMRGVETFRDEPAPRTQVYLMLEVLEKVICPDLVELSSDIPLFAIQQLSAAHNSPAAYAAGDVTDAIDAMDQIQRSPVEDFVLRNLPQMRQSLQALWLRSSDKADPIHNMRLLEYLFSRGEYGLFDAIPMSWLGCRTSSKEFHHYDSLREWKRVRVQIATKGMPGVEFAPPPPELMVLLDDSDDDDDVKSQQFRHLPNTLHPHASPPQPENVVAVAYRASFDTGSNRNASLFVAGETFVMVTSTLSQDFSSILSRLRIFYCSGVPPSGYSCWCWLPLVARIGTLDELKVKELHFGGACQHHHGVNDGVVVRKSSKQYNLFRRSNTAGGSACPCTRPAEATDIKKCLRKIETFYVGHVCNATRLILREQGFAYSGRAWKKAKRFSNSSGASLSMSLFSPAPMYRYLLNVITDHANDDAFDDPEEALLYAWGRTSESTHLECHHHDYLQLWAEREPVPTDGPHWWNVSNCRCEFQWTFSENGYRRVIQSAASRESGAISEGTEEFARPRYSQRTTQRIQEWATEKFTHTLGGLE